MAGLTNPIFKSILIVLMLSLALAGCGGGGGGGGGSNGAGGSGGGTTPGLPKSITSFSLANVVGVIDETNKTISVTVPFGTNLTALIANFSSTGSNVLVGGVTQYSGITPNDFTNPLAYVVLASDGSNVSYSVTVTVAPNSPKSFTSFSLSGWPGVVDEATRSIIVSMPSGSAVTALVATFTSTGAGVSVGGVAQTSGMTVNDFSNPVIYTVSAADGTTANYTVTISWVAPVTLNGKVSGLGGAGPIGLLNNGVDALTVSADGAFSFAQPVAFGAPYNVTISSPPPGQPCTLTYGTGHVSISNVRTIDVICGPAWIGTTSFSGTMATARADHSATLLPNGKVMVAGGAGPNVSSELYDPATAAWTTSGNMTAQRSNHTATLLPNGKVLVAGGQNFVSGLVNAELYDPATGTWTATGNMTTKRRFHTATLLPNGKVLVVGGENNGTRWASAELYDPATGIWTATGNMSTIRAFHTATLLPSGRLLVTGGTKGTALASAELYDPATGTWQTTGGMGAAREQHTATLLPNGKVLVAGGRNGSTVSNGAELYDPATETWSAAASMIVKRMSHTANLLPTGKVLAAAGFQGSTVDGSYELYDPATDTWSLPTSMQGVEWHRAVLLPNGKLLLTGGWTNFSQLTTAAQLIF